MQVHNICREKLQRSTYVVYRSGTISLLFLRSCKFNIAEEIEEVSGGRGNLGKSKNKNRKRII